MAIIARRDVCMMMASNTDAVFGFAPRKKVTTYGRAARRRSQATTIAALRHSESAPAVPTASAKSPTKSPSEAPRLSTRAASSSRARQQDIRNYGAAETREKAVEEPQSQPLPEPAGIEFHSDESARAKKRRLVRDSSDRPRFTGPYSTPDSSPPGARSPVSAGGEEAPRSAPNASPSKTASRKSTPEKGVDMGSTATASMPFSAKTTRTLKNLSLNSNKPETKKQQIPIRLSVSSPSKSAVSRKLSRPPVVSGGTQAQPPAAQPARKRRLIDALAEQAEEESSSSEDESDDEALSQGSSARDSKPPLGFPDAFPETTPPPTSAMNRPNALARPPVMAKKTGPKFTYSQQRTMLADDDDLLGGSGLGGLDDGPAGGALFNFGRLTKSATINTFSYLDEDDETVNTGAVRSIHELRQAGANSRFADEMDDILDRVGTPSAKSSSLRRGALLELAQKMKHKDFRQQFRNHSDGGSLFRSLGNETDVVSGYSILAIATTLLAATTSAHLIQQLRSQGLATLISRLLDQTADMTQLAKDRKQNVSRNGQMTLATIKSSLLALPVWEPFSPTSLSPRTLALKCLDLLMRQPSHASTEDEVLSRAVTDRLFSILSDGASDSACWDFPNQQESCDFHLALYVLEAHSISAMQSAARSVWTKHYAPIVANVLETAMARPTDQLGDLESLILRISLNVTNHNSAASRLFIEKGLLGQLAQSACGAFDIVMNSMKVDSFLSKVLEALIMMLGAMINFCVYYPSGSASLEERGDGSGSPLSRLIRVFADNHSKTADVSSIYQGAVWRQFGRSLTSRPSLPPCRRTRWKRRSSMSHWDTSPSSWATSACATRSETDSSRSTPGRVSSRWSTRSMSSLPSTERLPRHRAMRIRSRVPSRLL